MQTSDLESLAALRKIDLQALPLSTKNDLRALTVLMKPESVAQIRAAVQQEIPEPDCFIVEVMRCVDSRSALIRFSEGHGDPVKQREALSKLSESAASLAENISSLSYLSFLILRNGRSLTRSREDQEEIYPVEMNKDNQSALHDDLICISKVAGSLAHSYRYFRKGDLLIFNDDPSQKRPIFFRNEMIRGIAKAYATHSGKKVRMWKDEIRDAQSLFLKIINIVLSDIGSKNLSRQQISEILKM